MCIRSQYGNGICSLENLIHLKKVRLAAHCSTAITVSPILGNHERRYAILSTKGAKEVIAHRACYCHYVHFLSFISFFIL